MTIHHSGKTFLDLNSGDTFNRHNWFWCMDPMNPYIPPPIFPKWLTLPVHYQEKLGQHYYDNTDYSRDCEWWGIDRSLAFGKLLSDPQPLTWNGIIRSTEPQISSKYLGPGVGLTFKSIGVKKMPKYENGQNLPRIENNFKYHPPKDDQAGRYEKIRDAARTFAHILNDNTPMSREQSLAFTDLEDCVMHANAAIARNE